MIFPELNPESRVWVYSTHRELTLDELSFIEKSLAQFIPEWAAHGSKLIGNGIVHKSRFVILAVDETQVGASGCSIDSSQRFVKSIGAQLGLDFFNRVNMVVDDGNELNTVHISDLKDHLTSDVYNPMITKLKELNESWLIPVPESPFV